MSRFSGGRPSPSMVVAVIALSLALVGTAMAGTEAVVSALTAGKVKRISKKVANKQITKRAGRLTVAKAALADKATSSDKAASSDESTKLNGLEASQLVRVTGATAGAKGDPCNGVVFSNFESATFTAVASTSITAPVKGFLLVAGDTSAELDSSSPAGAEMRLLGRLTVDGKQTGVEAEDTLSDIALSCKEGRTMSLDSVEPVDAGDHTVAFEVAKSTVSGGAGKAWVGAGSVTALFVPFNGSGVQG